jgi:hypothetical protein
MINQVFVERVEHGEHESRRPISHDVVHVNAGGLASGERVEAAIQAERHVGKDKVFSDSQSTVEAKMERPSSATFRREVGATDVNKGRELAEERESKRPEFAMYLDSEGGKMVDVRSGSAETR